MINKEFEAQKQEIIDEVDALNSLGLINNEARAIIINPLNKLQPPEPPTCATCEHINLKCGSSAYGGFLCKNINALNADGGAVSTSGGYNIRIKNIDNFGCTSHSDYEVAE